MTGSSLGKRKRPAPPSSILRGRDELEPTKSTDPSSIGSNHDRESEHVSSDNEDILEDDEQDDATSGESGSSSGECSSEDEDMQEVFRRAFEKRFAPLTESKRREDATPLQESRETATRKRAGRTRISREHWKEEAETVGEDSSEEDVWDGLDDDDDDDMDSTELPAPTAVDIVDYTSSISREADMDSFNPAARSEARKFMSSKPPTFSAMASTSSTATKRPSSQAEAGEDESMALDAANDLALHRLISESHILAPNNSTLSHQGSTAKTTSRTTRHAQNDLRLQRLGARAPLSTLHAGKMPMQHRVGILKKKTETERRRRGEAKDAGVILERARKEKGREGGGKRRERSVGGPSIGKFRGGGTLILGKGDVRGIVGGGRGGRRGATRGGGRGGGNRR